jgi:hypothetical protein
MATAQRYDLKVTAGTGNLLLHKSVFDEVGLFDESLNQGGEDTELFVRIHTADIEAWYTPEAVVHHVIPMERLTDEYLISISRQMVKGLPEIERQDWGRLLFPLILAARIVRATVWTTPQFLFWAWAIKGDEAKLSARCRLAITVGYTREALPLLAPKWLTPKLLAGERFRHFPFKRHFLGSL